MYAASTSRLFQFALTHQPPYRLQPIFVQRFVINLRQIEPESQAASSQYSTRRFSSLRFHIPAVQDVVGSLGEPLEYGPTALGCEPEADSPPPDEVPSKERPGADAGTNVSQYH